MLGWALGLGIALGCGAVGWWQARSERERFERWRDELTQAVQAPGGDRERAVAVDEGVAELERDLTAGSALRRSAPRLVGLIACAGAVGLMLAGRWMDALRLLPGAGLGVMLTLWQRRESLRRSHWMREEGDRAVAGIAGALLEVPLPSRPRRRQRFRR